MQRETVRSKQGKVALVTGSGQGLGLAFAERLAAEGASLALFDLRFPPDLAERLRVLGAPDVRTYRLDLSEPEAVVDGCATLLEHMGRCDIVINNAGIFPRAPLSELSLELWRRTMAVNVESMFLICRELAPAMQANHYGRIVNLSSNTVGAVIEGFSHYMASKAAVIGFTRGLASELGVHGVTANVIAPGRTRTPSTEKGFQDEASVEIAAQAHAIKRLASPDDVVGTMSFLASDDARYVTGQTLIVDGGLMRAL